MITAIILTWKRHQNIDANLRTLLEEKEITEIIVFDNSGNFKTDLPVTVINSNHNFGANIRYSLASSAKNDLIFMMDDDIKIKKGLIADLLKYSNNNTACGICGKIFNGNSYKTGEIVKSEELEDYPKEVNHIIAYTLLMPKWMFLNHDYNKFSWICGELNLFGELKEINKVIVPTDKFTNLHEQVDQYALSLQSGASEEYERVFIQYYLCKS